MLMRLGVFAHDDFPAKKDFGTVTDKKMVDNIASAGAIHALDASDQLPGPFSH
jgi:hypothetical protein